MTAGNQPSSGWSAPALTEELRDLANQVAEKAAGWLPISGHVVNITFSLRERDLIVAALHAQSLHSGSDAQGAPDQRLTEDMTLAHKVRLATIEECARELECSYPRKNPPLNSYCARIRALSAVTPSPAQPPRTPLDLSAGELNTLATDAFREAAQGSAVAWTGEYDGHLDATIYRDTMERWKALGRKITPLYAVTPSPGAREETDEQLDERLAKQEARENLRLLDHIAHKIGLPIDQELSRENFNSWLSSVPSTDRGGK